jgi:hypothetical protein
MLWRGHLGEQRVDNRRRIVRYLTRERRAEAAQPGDAQLGQDTVDAQHGALQPVKAGRVGREAHALVFARSVDEDEARNILGMGGGEHTHVQCAQRVPDQHVGPRNLQAAEQFMQVMSNLLR